jgi:molybdopterin-guanine dinucleotide biosynthesis protein A
MRCSLAILCASDNGALPEESSLRELKESFADVMLCAKGLSLYLTTELTLITPCIAGTGPLSFLHAALILACHDHVLVVEGDRPLPPPPVLRFLAGHPSRSKALVLEENEQPFPGRYGRGCLKVIRAALRDGEGQVLPLLQRLRAAKLQSAELDAALAPRGDGLDAE